MKLTKISVRQRLKDWDVDIVLVTMVVLCLLLNAISMLTPKSRDLETNKMSIDLFIP